MPDDIQLHGLAALKSTLEKLPDRLGDRVVMAALRAAAQPIRKEAQARVPVLGNRTKFRKPGTVRKNITVRKSKKEKFAVFIGVQPYSRTAIREFKKTQKAAGIKVTGDQVKAFKKRLGQTISPDDPFYWWFVEFGTATSPAQPFLRPAFEAKKTEALQRFESYMAERVVKEAEKLAREMGMPA